MPNKTIKVSTLKVMINREYARCENLYNVYIKAGYTSNADHYAIRLSALIDLAAQIEQETGATIFEDEGEPCDNTLTSSSPAPTSQNTPVTSITTASAAL